MSDTTKKTWDDPKIAFEAWKYYGGIGGTDKDTMIKIVTLLLGFSTSIIGAYATGNLKEPFATKLLIGLGILLSILAAFTALLYGAYSAWNWAIADRIAETYDLEKLKPNYIPVPLSKTPWTAAFFLRLAKPCQNKIAPVFWMFFFISCLSLLVHVLLLFHAV